MEVALSILNSLGLAGLGVFLWFIWQGLKDRIKSLRELTEEQGRTLEAVRERAQEFDRLSQRYKQALADFDEMTTKTEARRKQVVHELEDAMKKKDAEIVVLKKAELTKVEKEQEGLSKISELAAQIENLKKEMRQQAQAITALDPLSEFHAMLAGPKATDKLDRFAVTIPQHAEKYAPTKVPPEPILAQVPRR